MFWFLSFSRFSVKAEPSEPGKIYVDPYLILFYC